MGAVSAQLLMSNSSGITKRPHNGTALMGKPKWEIPDAYHSGQLLLLLLVASKFCRRGGIHDTCT